MARGHLPWYLGSCISIWSMALPPFPGSTARQRDTRWAWFFLFFFLFLFLLSAGGLRLDSILAIFDNCSSLERRQGEYHYLQFLRMRLSSTKCRNLMLQNSASGMPCK
ncbi:hypothetical protein BJY00DRAFT_121736 [Aspergillus carlsbadensis]|nr:hypothetical protein BJY00DRAFT_121736 [Aspergillus carlsbadensis]